MSPIRVDEHVDPVEVDVELVDVVVVEVTTMELDVELVDVLVAEVDVMTVDLKVGLQEQAEL